MKRLVKKLTPLLACALVTHLEAQDATDLAKSLLDQARTGADHQKLNYVPEGVPPTHGFTVPAAPAFTALGVAPQNVIAPTTPQDFAAAVLSGVDANGNYQSGIAVQFAPYMIFLGEEVTIQEYEEHFMTRLLANTELSLATTKGSTDDDKSVRLAAGFRTILWQPSESDPRTSAKLDRAFEERLKLFEADAFPNVVERQKAIEELNNDLGNPENAMRKAWVESVKEFNKQNWNATRLELGVAPTWLSPDGGTSDMEWTGASIWTSFSYGFDGVKGLEDNSEIVLHARYRSEELVPDPNVTGDFLEQESILLGGRLRLGTDRMAFTIEGSFIHADRRDAPDDDYGRIGFGGAIRLNDDLWLELSVGGETKRDDDAEQVFVFGAFNYAFSSASPYQSS